MHYLYILRSSASRHYIGITDNVDNRILKHNRGDVRSTKAYRPWKVVHTEEFRDKTNARKRELFLKKTARARKELFANFSNRGRFPQALKGAPSSNG